MNINPPPRPIDHPDRFLDAQEAIEAAVLQVVDDAVAAGWGETEAIAAIVSIAENRMCGLGENAKLEQLLIDLMSKAARDQT